MSLDALGAFGRIGLVGAAFAGALLGVAVTLLLARGAEQGTALLLAGVIVGVMLAAAGDLVTTAAPEALRGKQAFMLGSTGFSAGASCVVLGLGLALVPAAELALRARASTR